MTKLVNPIGIISHTYAEMLSLQASNSFIAGQQYLITDFATTHYIVDSNGTQYLTSIITGVTEPIIVTALSSSKLDKNATSTLYPQDVLYYDLLPTNWLEDISFANAGTILTGFKGVIYFRHDTILDNYMGYDFRNCKFRRWNTNVAAYAAGTTYAAGAFVNYSGFIYKSLVGSNVGQTPSSTSNYWTQLLDLSITQYYNNNPTSTNGITSGTSYADFYTFTEGNGSATYNLGVRSNHFESFKDNKTYKELSQTILSGNVFFLQATNYFSVYANNIEAESSYNTVVANNFSYNNILFYWTNNTIGTNFSGNNIGVGCYNNILFNTFANNITGDSFWGNTVGNNCNNNTTSATYTGNVIGANCTNNKFGTVFQNNKIKNNFAHNETACNISNLNFGSATLVYNNYSKRLILTPNGTAKLIYIDNTGTQQIVSATS